MKPLLSLLIIASALQWGCKKDIQNEDAVRRGVMNYLAKRQDLTAMDVTVTKLAFRQNEADATVHFQAKGSTAPGSGLDMSYVLERQGNEWVVKGRTGPGHGGAMPGGMTGAENPHGMGAPPSGTMPSNLPPGHPPLQPKTTGPEK